MCVYIYGYKYAYIYICIYKYVNINIYAFFSHAVRMTFCLHLPLTSADWTSLVAAIIKWLLLRDDHWTFLYMLSSWWYEPMWKNLQLGNLPQISGWQKTYLKPSPRCFSMLCLYFGALSPFEYDTNSCSDFLGDQKVPKSQALQGNPDVPQNISRWKWVHHDHFPPLFGDV